MLDNSLLTAKALEYMGRSIVAQKKNDKALERTCCLKAILMERLMARNAVNALKDALEKLRAAKRSIKKAEKQGIAFALGEQWVEQLRVKIDQARKELSASGEALCGLLDLWQYCGATLKDLCNLCCRDYEQVLGELRPDEKDRQFSHLATIYDLDYKDPRERGWKTYDVDAPLTHALGEHLVDVVCNTKEGQAAAHAAMEAIFPEIMRDALTSYTDADGITHLIDKDGVEVGTMEEE